MICGFIHDAQVVEASSRQKDIKIELLPRTIEQFGVPLRSQKSQINVFINVVQCIFVV